MMPVSKNTFLSILPFLLVALMVMAGFLWYTGRVSLNFESLTTYANPMLGVSFRYPASWQPNSKYGFDEVSGRYEGENGFFNVDAIASEGDIQQVAQSLVNHKLKPYGEYPQILELIADNQEARAIIPSKDQPGGQNEVALIVRYPQPVKIRSNSYNFLVVVGDPKHIKMFTDTLRFNTTAL